MIQTHDLRDTSPTDMLVLVAKDQPLVTDVGYHDSPGDLCQGVVPRYVATGRFEADLERLAHRTQRLDHPLPATVNSSCRDAHTTSVEDTEKHAMLMNTQADLKRSQSSGLRD